ncbi:PREDICTED: cytochrome P450 2J5-like [Priapulus caudatus]|uniref:Cytochrome P450 2J5-like n=1 Tax=Priapulus caudatus TaxID=37621 RepID=A0ABM1EQR8_PRICU|nr:PREDICTED: cytochrome P450 2J5-like [Priapulus caudatus]
MGRAWKSHRKFTLSTLRNFGMGKVSVEKRIQEEVVAFLNVVRAEGGRPFDVQPIVVNSVANVICSLTCGGRYDYENPEFKELCAALHQLFRNLEVSGPINFCPYLRHLPPLRRIVKELRADSR